MTPLFNDPDYRRLWFAAACNQQGASGEHIVLGLLVFRATGSTEGVGVMMAAYFLPFFVIGMLSGAIADWMDRRALLRRIECLIILNQLAFAGTLLLGATALWSFLPFTLLAGSLRALHQPARISYAYDITGPDRVVAALGLLNLGARSGQLIGALVTGWIMQGYGAPAAMLAIAGGHGIALIMLSRLRRVGIAADGAAVPMRRTLRALFTELGGNRMLVALLLLTAAVEVFGFSFSTALPELATNRLHLGADGLGILQAARAGGGILAGLAMAGMGRLRRRGVAFLVVIYVFGASVLLLSADSALTFTLAAIVAVSAMAAASDVLTQSMMQLCVANHLRGRAMGLWVLAVGFAPIGHLEIGALTAAIGLNGALFANGVALLGIAVLITLAFPALRRL